MSVSLENRWTGCLKSGSLVPLGMTRGGIGGQLFVMTIVGNDSYS
jgi:hypothetical protein